MILLPLNQNSLTMRTLLYFGLLLLLTACGGTTDEVAVETPIRAVRADRVTLDDGTSSQVFNGVAEAAGRTPLSFRVAGTLRTLPVNLGQRVRRGQLIATIDPADLQVQQSQATAQRAGQRGTAQKRGDATHCRPGRLRPYLSPLREQQRFPEPIRAGPQ